MDGDFWFRAVGMVAFCGALFVVPIVTLMRDDRRAKRLESDRFEDTSPVVEHSV